MKSPNRAASVALLALTFLAVSCNDAPIQPEVTPSFSLAGQQGSGVADQYLVLFKTSLPADFASRVEALGGSVVYTHDAGVAIVRDLSDAAVAELGRARGILDIQPDDIFKLDPITALDPESYVDQPLSPQDPTAAYFYARQWNMRTISADQAWASGRTGSGDVSLAILDTGIDYLYPDLDGRVDLSRSASFVAFDDLLVSIYFPTRHPITDLHFHGTHVASIAVSNSNVIAGVSSETTLIGVKVCDVTGSCPFSSIVMGMLHAVDVGADAINLSLGGSFAKPQNGRFVGFINQLFNYANANGVTVVVGAGNAGADLDHDASSFQTYCSAPNAICVSATGPTSGGTAGPWTDVDDPAPYTNFGRSAIGVAAPGGTGPDGAWVWAACSQTSLVIPICGTGAYVLGVNGTSMAAPHVAGLAAMMVEDYGRNPARIRAQIRNTADDLGQPGTDPYYGKGRIDVYRAISQ